MASDYAYQVMCRIEFRESDAKPRWYTIGQYNDQRSAVGRAKQFCRYLAEMRTVEPARNKPHSLLAVFEIRGPNGSWTQCEDLVPKGVNIFAMMRNEKGERGARGAPKQAPAVTYWPSMSEGGQMYAAADPVTAARAHQLAKRGYEELEWHFGRGRAQGLRVGVTSSAGKTVFVGHPVNTTLPEAVRYLHALQRQKSAAKAKPAARARAAVAVERAGVVLVVLEARQGRSAITQLALEQYTSEDKAKQEAARALKLVARSHQLQKGIRYRTTVRSEGGKLLAYTEWVAA